MYNFIQGLVGAGIARPIYADDTVRPRRKVTADMGRAMPAPTKLGVELYIVAILFWFNRKIQNVDFGTGLIRTHF